MKTRLITGWSPAKLRGILLLFFLALIIPTAILIVQAYSQLKWESFHQQRVLAESFVSQVDQRFNKILDKENARSFTDYSFLNIVGGKGQRFLQRSLLSSYPVKSSVPGVISYFQVDNDGRLTTPLLPEMTNGRFYGLSTDEIKPRLRLFQRLRNILHKNSLVVKETRSKRVINKTTEKGIKKSRLDTRMPASPQPVITSAPSTVPAKQQSRQAGFDKLQTRSPRYYSKSIPGKADSKQALTIGELKLKRKYKEKIKKESLQRQAEVLQSSKYNKKRKLRLEKNVIPSQKTGPSSGTSLQLNDRLQVRIFESEIDSFEFSMLEDGNFILYRNVWRNKKRYIQGMLINANQFITELIENSFKDTALSSSSNLVVAFKGDIISVIKGHAVNQRSYDAQALQGMLLLKDQLSASKGQLELLLNIKQLPAGPGGSLLIWLSIILLVVLVGGFYLLYRLGLRQINLIQQQQNFVSAVSHELKTPLTSIRMYGEMLREGWTPEEKRKVYYDYIYNESERLTRLINNVLQLARMTRNDLKVNMKSYTVAELMDLVLSRLSSQAEQARYILDYDCSDDLRQSSLNVDSDFFVQIFINLVDNAIKFSSSSKKKKIDLQCEALSNNRIQFSIRDYGPGIKPDQLRKIFSLFYRSEDELTRETVGTGIGLALVKELIQNMNGSIDIVNVEPGAEFRLVFNLQ